MGTTPPGPDQPDDQAREQMYALGEEISEELPRETPNWCQIARDARTLADQAARYCAGTRTRS
jgi:hypothetical protein